MIEATLADLTKTVDEENVPVYESAEMLMTKNAYRLFVDGHDDTTLTVLCKPNGAARWYEIQSYPNSGTGNIPLMMEAGDELKVRVRVIGNSRRAAIRFFLNESAV